MLPAAVARLVMPAIGVTGLVGLTDADPPPPYLASVPASSPMTATDVSRGLRGRTFRSFLSSTVPCSEAVSATWLSAGVLTSVLRAAAGVG